MKITQRWMGAQREREREREREGEREIPNPTPRPLKKSIPMSATTASPPPNTNKRLGVHKVVLGTQFFLI